MFWDGWTKIIVDVNTEEKLRRLKKVPEKLAVKAFCDWVVCSHSDRRDVTKVIHQGHWVASFLDVVDVTNKIERG